MYINDSPEPLAEVHPQSKKFHIIKNNQWVDIPDNLYSVTGKKVNIRRGYLQASTKVGEVKQGDLVVVLREKEGWYEISLIKDGKASKGWILAALVAPLASTEPNQESTDNTTSIRPAMPIPKPYNCQEMQTGDYSFTNKTNKTLLVRLYSGTMPTEWIGNPGNPGKIMTLAAYEKKTYFNLPSDVYKYFIMETGDAKEIRRFEALGEIKIETCQKLNYDVQ